jgi:hypothetical protein
MHVHVVVVCPRNVHHAQPDPQQRPSAAALLKEHPRLISKVEQELLREKRRNEALQIELVRAHDRTHGPP